MEPFTEAQIRAAFINCSQGDASRIKLPADFAATPWSDLDYFGWVDPSAPLRAAMVVADEDGLRAIMLRKADRVSGRGAMRASLCQACLTSHPAGGVSLFTAAYAGPSGRNGNSVGELFCSDLACSLYLRGLRRPRSGGVRVEETLSLQERVDRELRKIHGFVRRVAEPSTAGR
ncbi:FBP domain-containing protein [Hamadaea tsunoensis]|uniref:FBP domain-containing protein n=1 Tax=Hamadaea tsunoensis TaxID=53368 RepID=UPI0003F6D55F|nr:FBP domain-containing protein [Hamadaea tsunoensis]